MNVKLNITIVIMAFIVMIGLMPMGSAFAATASDSNSGSSNFTEHSRNNFRGGGVQNFRASRGGSSSGLPKFTEYARNSSSRARTRSYRSLLDEEDEIGL